MHDCLPRLQPCDFPALRRDSLQIVQVNLGYRCNQRCIHCHVNAGPTRTEMMDDNTIEAVLAFLRQSGVGTLDLTGGAPEMHPRFRTIVEQARALGATVIDRCNLTILGEEGQQGLADFLAEHQVQVVASLPCYLEENVDGQRGDGVFRRSIEGIRQLNALGYGREPTLPLNLVYNPTGAFLPPPQQQLEADYKARLAAQYGIVFTRLLTITNMPIKRFGSWLISHQQFDDYMQLLRAAYHDANCQRVMCRSLISIDWQGYVHDCDFNQMLKLPLGGRRTHISALTADQLDGAPIAVLNHCYGCTAGQGSSCSGAL